MKTAMQEAIRIMEETMSDKRCDNVIAKAIQADIKLLKGLLEKEKEQIKDAWQHGDSSIDAINSEQYYNQTYKPLNNG